jgi:hypothetical protein
MVVEYAYDVAPNLARIDEVSTKDAGSSWRRGDFHIPMVAISDDVRPAFNFPTFKVLSGLLLTEVS